MNVHRTLIYAWLFPISIHATWGHTGGWRLVNILDKRHDCPVSQNSLCFWWDVCTELESIWTLSAFPWRPQLYRRAKLDLLWLLFQMTGITWSLLCPPHPSLSVLVVLKCCVHFCPAPRLLWLELVSEWALWRWWRADVAGALQMIWGQTLDWAWRAFKER